MRKDLKVKNLAELSQLAGEIQKKIVPRTLVLLDGPLGTGKTAFVKKLMKLYGLKENFVKSPTFSLINVYPTTDLIFYHLDLYRLDEPDLFLIEEIKEMLAEPNSVILIEWPQTIPLEEMAGLVRQLIEIKISFDTENFRNFSVYVK